MVLPPLVVVLESNTEPVNTVVSWVEMRASNWVLPMIQCFPVLVSCCISVWLV